jgi:hypothetical protein
MTRSLQANEVRNTALEALKTYGFWRNSCGRSTLACSIVARSQVKLDLMLSVWPFPSRFEFSDNRWASGDPNYWTPGQKSWCLDVWCGNKVLSVQWCRRDLHLTTFRRGFWERVLEGVAAKAVAAVSHTFQERALEEKFFNRPATMINSVGLCSQQLAERAFILAGPTSLASETTAPSPLPCAGMQLAINRVSRHG